MQLIRNPVIGWNTLPREYSAGSIPNSSSTAGVIHPPHGLLRGKPCLSRIVTSMPECRNFQAQEEPAGPPPTIRMSHESIAIPVLRSARLCRGERGSRESADNRGPQKRSGTVAGYRLGTQLGLRRGKAARFSQILNQTFRKLGRLTSRICPTNAPASWRSELPRRAPASRQKQKHQTCRKYFGNRLR